MLRAFRLETGWWDSQGVMMWARRLLGGLLLAAAMALACRVQLMPGVAAFGMALLAAALMAGRSAAALLAGCLLAAVEGTLRDFNLRLPVGAAIALGGVLLWEGARDRLAGGGANARGFRRRLAENLARSPNLAEQAVGCALAGLATLVPALVWAEGLDRAFGEIAPLRAAQALGSALAAVAATPFLRAALDVGPRRRFLAKEERLGLALLLAVLTAGLGAVYLPAAAGLALALAILCHPAGAAMGAGLGAALLILGADARLAALLAAGGLAAQLCGERSRSARASASAGTALVLALFLQAPLAWLGALAAGGLLPLALPGEWARRLVRWSAPERRACDPDRLAAQLRRQTVRRLNALGAAFGELAEGYLAPCDLPDEGALMGTLRQRLCEGCGNYEVCWAGEDNRGARLLCDLIAEAVAWAGGGMAEPLFDGEVTPALLRRCRRGRLIPERLGEPLEDFARARASGLKRGAENRLISAQFLQARALLDRLAAAEARPVRLRDRQAQRAAAVLEQAGIPLAEAMMLGGGEVALIAVLREGGWSQALLATAARRLSRAFGRVYAPAGVCGGEARFVRRPRLSARTGAGCASRDAGAPSGDSHLTAMLDHERLLVLICDGMGSGPAAAEESAAAVRLLGRFLTAGAEVPLAIETVNALLINRGGEDMFATVDMLILNLSDGSAELVKLAASPTLILRDGEARWVEGGRLPMGILEKVRPARSRLRLMPGDRLLMASDGVTDCLPLEALAGLLGADAEMPDIAQRILAEAGGAGGRRDDMTAICLELCA